MPFVIREDVKINTYRLGIPNEHIALTVNKVLQTASDYGGPLLHALPEVNFIERNENP